MLGGLDWGKRMYTCNRRRAIKLIPDYIVLVVLAIFMLLAVIVAWFAILFTGRYPKGLFDFVVGTMRWFLRVQAYVVLLVTDRYPPFSMS